jgi:hypothetical protein
VELNTYREDECRRRFTRCVKIDTHVGKDCIGCDGAWDAS